MKRLIFRLSSLGDLILSQSVLESPYAGETHWVVAKEYEGLVLGNPKITQVWSFDRKKRGGIASWLRFLGELRREEFTEVLDLHSTLRTQIARFYFRVFASRTHWKKISKERSKRAGYEVLKRFWPVKARPTHFAKRCALLSGGYGNERPNLRWLLGAAVPAYSGGTRIAVVPASAWPGKEWPFERYLEWIKRHRETSADHEFILVRTVLDRSAVALRDALVREKIPFHDGVGKYTWPELARLFSTCSIVVGADSGLLHFAEAIGTPVITLFGPTLEDFGFGPLDERSRPVHSGLWCSPCSKDGSLCFRLKDRYACLKRLEPHSVEGAVRLLLTPTMASEAGIEKKPSLSSILHGGS